MPKFRPASQSRAREVVTLGSDADRFLILAKELVTENYNRHRDQDVSPPIGTDEVYILWFSDFRHNCKVVVASTTVKTLVWFVTYIGPTGEAHIDVYKKVKGVKVAVRSD